MFIAAVLIFIYGTRHYLIIKYTAISLTAIYYNIANLLYLLK